MSRAGRRVVVAGVVLALLLLLGVLEAAQVYLGLAARGRPIPFAEAITGTLPSWIILAALVPGVAWLCARFPLERATLLRDAAAHVAGAIAFTAAHLAGTAAIAALRAGAGAFGDRLSALATIYFVLDMLTYAAVGGVILGVRHYRERKAHEVATSRLLASLAEGRLSALRGQLRPDFLFNTLNTVAILVQRGDAQGSGAVLASLSALFRASLDDRRTAGIPLREEMALLREYLAIQRVRYGARFDATLDAGRDAAHGLVPPLLFQPLVEELIAPALSRSRETVTLRLSARREGAGLVVELRRGPALKPDAGARPVAATEETRSRLEALFGRGAVDVARDGAEGDAIRITMPVRAAAVPAVAAAAWS